MRFVPLELPGVYLVESAVHTDHRGFFVERFQEAAFVGSPVASRFCQDNHSRSLPRVLRGLHYQVDPPQGKLVSVIRGRIWDVAVDLRAGSPTFGRYVGVELSDGDGRALWVPEGFAHGFCVLGDDTADVVYKVTAPYQRGGQRGVRFDDDGLAVAWPIRQPVLSGQDERLPSFSAYRAAPAFA